MKQLRLLPIATAIWLLYSIVAGGTAFSQPVLTLTQTHVAWPQVSVRFRTECNGALEINKNVSDYRVRENGKVIANFLLGPPATILNMPISAALVFDCSSSMAGTGMVGAMNAGHAFVEKMDGLIDEAAIISFGSNVTVCRPMTTTKSLLHSGVDALLANGIRQLWDGAYAGLIELINDGINQIRFMVVLAGGADNSPSRTPAEIIALAKRHQLRVFSVVLGNASGAVDMERLAVETGGEYFQTQDASQLVPIFEEIFEHVRKMTIDGELVYDSECPDGGNRTMELEIANICGDVAMASFDFTALMDSSEFTTIDMSLGQAIGLKDSDVRMPVNQVTTLAGNTLHPFGFRIIYDTTRLELTGAEGPPGSLYEGAAFTVTPFPGGATVETAESRRATGPGRMFDLIFRTNAQDTGCVDVDGDASWFTGGCMIPRLNNTTLCVFRQMPVMSCTVLPPPLLSWDKDRGRYEPDGFPIVAYLLNSGSVEARLLHIRIEYSKLDFTLGSPLKDTVFFPSRLIGPGETPEFSWRIVPRMGGTLRNRRVCIVAAFSNHTEVSRCVDVLIPPATAHLSCVLTTPVVAGDTINGTYNPMPFTASLSVKNEAGWEAVPVSAIIELPGDLELAPPDDPGAFTKLTSPINLYVGGIPGTASWSISHPLSRIDRDYTLRVRTFAPNSDTCTCESSVHIPGLPEVSVAKLTASGPLVFCYGDSVVLDAGGDRQWYRWNIGYTGRRLTVTESGLYYCWSMAADGRYSVTDTVRVTVHPLPDTRCIDRFRDVLVCNIAAHAYQWFKDDQELPGEILQTLSLTSIGTYRVHVTTQAGCTTMSDPFVVSAISAVIPAHVRSFDVWPDPNDGRLRVRLRTEIPVRTSLIVRNILGQEVARHDSPSGTTDYAQDIDLSASPAGVYFLFVTSGDATFVRPVVRR